MLKEYLSEKGFLWGPENNPYGVSGFMVYGPLGTVLKHRIENSFRGVFRKEGFEEIETPVLYPAEAWEASGHLQRHAEEMFKTETSDGRALLGRPELATTMYPMFNQLLQYYHNRLPFRISQMGISLPNDRQTEWQLRTRQYTAHEGHIVIKAESEDPAHIVDYLAGLSFTLMAAAGISENSLVFQEKTGKEKPFYSSSAFGLYTTFEDNRLELLGIQYRSSYDFRRHSEQTHIPLTVNGDYPEAFEISFSTDRPFLVILSQALSTVENRLVLKIPEHLAPISAQIMPLKNNTEMISLAEELADLFNKANVHVPIMKGSDIGRRYAQADAIGVPYCFTIDTISLNKRDCTIRCRDTQHQVRIPFSVISEKLSNTQYGITITDFLQQLYRSENNTKIRKIHE
ncbi:MAG: His/Gly/Thr/Pro-type tRNA ligase C-terminal domain-containing protein [Candidatus Gottesmanbacteria bacterium]|nr:His/Gly/Thr/Pro-type tRNA ligase C-terminal domain-containing protein [Candidatus Gottesmanbacteria bacterium]